MKAINTEITIQASSERVWDILTDFEKYPSWNPFLLSIEGNLEKGARLATVINNAGKESRFKPVVTEFSPGSSFAWLGKLPLGIFTGKHYFAVEDLGNGQTRLVHGERFGGWLRGMIMKKIGEDTRRGFVAMNEALKQRAENWA